ncbi:MAG: cofactor-independent phosphoglycerate mutase [Bacillota bacterium]
MKYIVILGDGMADYPLPELGGRTPLEAAEIPYMDQLAQKSLTGMARTIPPDMPPGSDVANLSVLGYDPRLFYTGRSPLEALSMGVNLGDNDVALRCNLVTLSGERDLADRTMVDYSSDEISSGEAREIIQTVQERLGGPLFTFYPGVSYRHLLVWRGGETELDLTPPHDISGRRIGPYLPKGKGAEKLSALIKASTEFLADHPVNIARGKRSLKPATALWFWGHGKRPSLPPFRAKYGLAGAVISAVDLAKGIGICAGMETVEVPGATGNIHTNFRGKAEAALECLAKGKDFAYIHIEAPDEAGHRGETDTKIKAIEAIDRLVVRTILEGMRGRGDFKLLILPDHPTPLSRKTHVAEAVPFLIFESGAERSNFPCGYDEKIGKRPGSLFVDEGFRLMDLFISGRYM